MKTIIAGSRSIVLTDAVLEATTKIDWNVTEVVSGTARGVDRLGEWWAAQNGIPIKRFPANWDKYGKSAGFLRNKEMAKYADALIAIWDGKSRGTKHMINLANDLGLKVYVHRVSYKQK